MQKTFFVISKPNFRRVGVLPNVIAGTVIWTVIFPIALLHAWVWIYQEIYFSIYEIPKAKWKDYVTYDRNELGKLTIWQKFACAYCSYANGTIAWIKVVINRTEMYSCAIKHKTPKLGQEHQAEFLPYEDFR